MQPTSAPSTEGVSFNSIYDAVARGVTSYSELHLLARLRPWVRCMSTGFLQKTDEGRAEALFNSMVDELQKVGRESSRGGASETPNKLTEIAERYGRAVGAGKKNISQQYFDTFMKKALEDERIRACASPILSPAAREPQGPARPAQGGGQTSGTPPGAFTPKAENVGGRGTTSPGGPKGDTTASAVSELFPTMTPKLLEEKYGGQLATAQQGGGGGQASDTHPGALTPGKKEEDIAAPTEAQVSPRSDSATSSLLHMNDAERKLYDEMVRAKIVAERELKIRGLLSQGSTKTKEQAGASSGVSPSHLFKMTTFEDVAQSKHEGDAQLTFIKGSKKLVDTLRLELVKGKEVSHGGENVTIAVYYRDPPELPTSQEPPLMQKWEDTLENDRSEYKRWELVHAWEELFGEKHPLRPPTPKGT